MVRGDLHERVLERIGAASWSAHIHRNIFAVIGDPNVVPLIGCHRQAARLRQGEWPSSVPALDLNVPNSGVESHVQAVGTFERVFVPRLSASGRSPRLRERRRSSPMVSVCDGSRNHSVIPF
jgi:hypothetical protein